MKSYLEKYAKLAVTMGVNVQKGQLLVISAPVEAYEFVQLCVKEAYEVGAGEVEVRYSDALITKYHYEYQETKRLKDIATWVIERQKHAVEEKGCFLHIVSDVVGNLKHIDANKLQEVSMAQSQAMQPFRYYTMNNIGQWCVIAYPNKQWATTVFPELSEEEAMKELWSAIFKSVRIEEDNDVVQCWKDHNKKLAYYNEQLNKYNFKTLHFKNSLGTDCMVDLVEGHRWCGGSEKNADNVEFNPNLPTEETFTTPKRNGVNGVVVATKPLNYQGKCIENFSFVFKDGKVVDFHAEKEHDVLANLLSLDEGSSYLGEIALISHETPISQMNVLFYNTLFDENASCHMALGASYPTCIKDGDTLTSEQLLERQSNQSMAHEDFMFGSACMNVVGITYDNQHIQLFKEGNFCI